VWGFLLLFLRFYLRESERAQTGGVAGRGRSRLPTGKELDVGLNPRTPGS